MKTLQNLILFLCLIFALQAHGSNCFLLAGKVFKESQSLSKVLPFDTAQTVGMEFEGVITANMTNLDLATYIGKYLNEKGIPAKVEKEHSKDESSYLVRFNESVLTVLDDASLNTTEQGKGVEITSPVMRNTQDVDLYLSILNHLKVRKILNIEEDLGGIHIHYGVPNLKIGELKMILQFFYLNTNTIRSAFKMKATRMQDNPLAIITSIDLLEKYNPNSLVKDLPEHINFPKSIIRYKEEIKTLELRVFNSSLEENEQITNINFTKRIIDNLLESSPSFHDEINSIYLNAKSRLDPIEIKRHSGLHDNEFDSEGDPYLQSLFALISEE